jgi:putative flippase GtrA
MDTKKKERLIEIIAYTVFGALTTAVGMLTYFGILWFGESVLSIAPSSSEFYVVRLLAQILHWIAAVLFAFFTNKRWVFTTADKDVSTAKQLIVFASGRLLTLGLDTVTTLGTVLLLQAIGYEAPIISFIITFTLSADVVSKIVASVFVLIANYFISKIFVFKTKK